MAGFQSLAHSLFEVMQDGFEEEEEYEAVKNDLASSKKVLLHLRNKLYGSLNLKVMRDLARYP